MNIHVLLVKADEVNQLMLTEEKQVPDFVIKERELFVENFQYLNFCVNAGMHA